MNSTKENTGINNLKESIMETRDMWLLNKDTNNNFSSLSDSDTEMTPSEDLTNSDDNSKTNEFNSNDNMVHKAIFTRGKWIST